MRRAIALLVLLALVAPASAHVGMPLRPLDWQWTEVTPDDPVHQFPLYMPVDLQSPEQVLLFTIHSQGPADLSLTILVDEIPVYQTPLPSDGTAHPYFVPIETPGNLTLQLDHDGSTESGEVAFMWDVDIGCDFDPRGCITKIMPWELVGGNAVFPALANEPGDFVTTIAASNVHDLELTVWNPDLTFQVAHVAEKNSLGEIVLRWTATETGTYHLQLHSASVNEDPIFDAPSAAAGREELRITALTDGPFTAGLPGPAAPLLVVAVLALACVLRTRQD